MGEYADVKRGRVLKLLKWIETLSEFSVDNGGNHQWLVKHGSWERPFPIPFKYGVVNKHIVKDLMKRVVATGVCDKEIFDEHLK